MIRRRWLAAALIGFPLQLAGEEPPDLAALVATIDAAAPAALARHDTPGAGVAMVLGGTPVWSKGYGIADAETGAPVTADTIFEIASLTKPVTAWAMLRLAEEGRIDLDAPIETYLGGWTLPPSGYDHAGVSARSILAHGAGLAAGGDSGVPPGEPVPTLLEAANGAGMEFGAVRVTQAPGHAFRYSSKGYALLEMAVETVTGEPFADHVGRSVLQPLGMEDSAFGWSTEGEERAARGHDWYGNPLPHYRHATKAPGGLVATPMDVARFVAASMETAAGEPPGRSVISPGSVRATLEPFPFENDTSTVGLGYNLHIDGETLVARKGGDHPGYKAMLFSMPEIGAGLVILANSDRAAPGLFADIACPWSEAMPGDPLRHLCRQLYVLRNAHWGAGAGIALLGGLIAWRVARGLRNGSRARPRPYPAVRSVMAGGLVFILLLWWGFWYSDVPLGLLGFPPSFHTVRATPWPTAFIAVSWGVSVLIAALVLLLMFPRLRRSPDPQARARA